jgi:DNA-binding IclR family transcriptional regulator
MKLTSLDKSLKVLDALTKSPQGLTVAQLSAELGFPSSTIHHMLSTFREHDYVAQNTETKKYLLGFKFLTVGSVILDNLDVRRVSYHHLRKLQQQIREAVHLSILRDGQVTYIDKVQQTDGLGLATFVGFSTDPHAAAGGKILLCELPAEKVRAIYRKRPLKKYGKNTITNMDVLLAELENVRKQGYAIDDEEYYEGVRCVAAPIRAGGRIIAAISITGSIFTMTLDRINRELVERVLNTAEKISSEMRW